MTADVVREQEPPPKDVKSDDPDDFIEEIDSTDDVQEVNGQRNAGSSYSRAFLLESADLIDKIKTEINEENLFLHFFTTQKALNSSS